MVNQLGEHLPELHEEAFARHILIGKHVEFHLIQFSDIRQQLLILGFEERGRRDGYRLMTGRKHRPAVATSLRNKQPLARFQSLHNRQVIDAASCAVREPEAGSFLLLLVIQVPVLDSYKPPIGIEVRKADNGIFPPFFTFLFLILTGIMVNRRYEIKKEVKFGA